MLTDEQKKRAKKLSGSYRPRAGWKVRLWDAGGLWSVWSEGSGRSLWYIQPVDQEARDLLTAAHGRGGAPVSAFERTFSYAAEVKTSQMRKP